MNRPTLSLAMIAKNEEENIERLYRSVEGCFDEIHLTDTGSTDRTVEIALKLGMKVHHFKWIDDFSAARNFSFSKISTDYTMWMDLDDVLENKDQFIMWRDEVMKLGDFWLAPYHYASDPTGKVACSFVRERVIKNGKGFNWKYFVHEGIIPDPSFGPVNMQMAPSWAIRHKRTSQDLAKDKSRNLNLFKSHQGNLDARMTYYYGKELFEAGKPLEAVQMLAQALSDPKLELHDRILGMQYCCYGYIQMNQFEHAMQMAQQGLLLAPNRAEFFSIMGDCYLKQNRLIDAVPVFEAAKACQFVQPGSVTPIFHQEDMYTVYPRNQLSRIFTHLGDLDRAEKESKSCVETYRNPEADLILKEIQRIKKEAVAFHQANPCEDIVISCVGPSAYEFDPGIMEEKSMGGSETALIEMAHWLKKLSGRPVKVFNMRKEDKTFSGVEYISNEKLQGYFAKNQPYFHIAWRHNIKLTSAPTFVWSHDLQTPGVDQINNYEKVLCLTPFHSRYMQITQNVPESKIFVTRNGINPKRYIDIDVTKKDPNRFVFGSSPDRGLERCIRVLDKVREVHPKITLHVHYGYDHFYKTGQPHLIQMADRLKEMIQERSWITYHGATQQDELTRSYLRSAYVIQPSDWIETSCISAMEFLCCGVYPIFRKVGGVADTLSRAEEMGMATLVDSDCITEQDYQKYVDATLQAMDQNKYLQVSADVDSLSWEKVAQSWLEELPKFFTQEVKGVHGVSA